MSTLNLLYNSLISREHLLHLFYQKETFVAFYITIRQLINNKVFEHANLIFTELLALANVMKNFKTDFLENEFWVNWCVRFKLYFHSMGYFSLYRGILEPKNNTSILHKNGSFANTNTCCCLTALFRKTKIYFCH